MRRRFDHIIKLGFVFLFLGVPFLAQAACSASGYTVIFVNGINTTENKAKEDKEIFEFKLGSSFNSESVTTILGHNETHGLDEDAIETTLPQLSQHDIDAILMNLQSQVKTRKIIIVGHSQGAMYANRMYDYLISHGEPADSVAIYGIATPETILEHKGRYLNYEGDTTIYSSLIQFGAVVPPPPNVSVKDFWDNPNAKGKNVGHDFVEVYLDNFTDRIMSDIKSQMFVLRSTDAPTDGYCFEAPVDTFGHKTAGVLLAVGKPVLGAVNTTMIFAWNGLMGSIGFVSDTTTAVGNFFSRKPPKDTAAKERAANDAGVVLLNALNMTSLDVQTADQLQRDAQKKKDNNSQGSAVVLAFMQDEPAPAGEVLGASDSLEVATTVAPVAFPTAPEAVPGEVVHYNAPTFGGPAAAQEEQSEAASGSPPEPDPEPAPVVLVPPVISFGNWHASTDAFFCSGLPRYVDLSWGAVPGAAYYEVRTDDALPTPYNELSTTTALAWPNLVLATTNDRIDPITVTVTAFDAAGNNAAGTARADQALADQTPPQLLSDLLSPAFAPLTPTTEVSINTTVTIPFNEPLAASTVTANAFILSSKTEDARIDASLSLGGDGTTVTLTPLQPLHYGNRYNLSVACTVSDIYGNRLPNSIGFVADPDSQYFTTVAAPAPPPGDPQL